MKKLFKNITCFLEILALLFICFLAMIVEQVTKNFIIIIFIIAILIIFIKGVS